MPFPVSYRGSVPVPASGARPDRLLAPLAAALRERGASEVRAEAARVEFRVRYGDSYAPGPLFLADAGALWVGEGPAGPVLRYEVSTRRAALVAGAVCAVWLGG